MLPNKYRKNLIQLQNIHLKNQFCKYYFSMIHRKNDFVILFLLLCLFK